MLRIFPRSAASGAIACVAHPFSEIDVYGAYADRLTVEDLRQIRDAARNRKDISLPLSLIDVEAPDRIRVITGHSRVIDRKFFQIEFRATKKSGAWTIDTHSVKKQQGSVVSGDEPDERAIVD